MKINGFDVNLKESKQKSADSDGFSDFSERKTICAPYKNFTTVM